MLVRVKNLCGVSVPFPRNEGPIIFVNSNLHGIEICMITTVPDVRTYSNELEGSRIYLVNTADKGDTFLSMACQHTSASSTYCKVTRRDLGGR